MLCVNKLRGKITRTLYEEKEDLKEMCMAETSEIPERYIYMTASRKKMRNVNANSKGSDQYAHMSHLIRAYAVHQNWIRRNL